jgi:hypothetical protein
MELTEIDRRNDKLCTAVARLAAEHAEMAAFIKSALPFLKGVKICSVYQDGANLVDRVGRE